tara:strand:- start:1822 stop:2967 length:1146 start_codon:yes stop_codon:yes gene_type:complete
MWFYQAINRLPAPRSYLGKILFVSFIGVHVPLIAAVVYVLMTAGFSPEALQPIIIVVLIATLAGTGLTFAALYALLAPVRQACAAMRGYLEDRTIPALPSEYQDAAGILLRDVQEGVTRLDTALDLAETKRRDAVREKNESLELVSGMSHELRTPLNAIIGFSEMMQNELLGPVGTPAYKGYATDIVTSGSQLLDKVQNILDMGQISTGKFKGDMLEIDIAALARDVVALKHHHAQRLGVILRSDFNLNTLTMLADTKAMKQSILNLLSVAISTTEAKGRVAVQLREEQGHHELRIADTGRHLGSEDIPASLLKDIDDTTKSAVATPDGIVSYSDTALSLSVAASMLAICGVEVKWHNIPEGGKLFRLILPVNQPGIHAAS